MTHHQLDSLVLDHRVGLHSGGSSARRPPAPRPPGPAAARPPPHSRAHTHVRDVTTPRRKAAPAASRFPRSGPQLPAAPAAPRSYWLREAPGALCGRAGMAGKAPRRLTGRARERVGPRCVSTVGRENGAGRETAWVCAASTRRQLSLRFAFCARFSP